MISYLITACNEKDELEYLIQQIDSLKRKEDEIVFLLDDEKATEDVVSLCFNYKKAKLVRYPLYGNFAFFKNYGSKHCKNPWIMQLDADEYFSETLYNNFYNLFSSIQKAPNVELVFFPRYNIVNGITKEHIEKWGWNIQNIDPRLGPAINYPDMQGRLYRNSPEIFWVGKVHERINTKNSGRMDLGLDIMHIKTIERQERQNKLYSNL